MDLLVEIHLRVAQQPLEAVVLVELAQLSAPATAHQVQGVLDEQ
jgi:hypothetical protein